MNLARYLVNKLPDLGGKFGIPPVHLYRKGFNFHDKKLKFEKASWVSILNILKELKTKKTTGIDNLTGRFLKDSSDTCYTSLARIWNLSIKLAFFPDKCKVTKIKPLYKKGLKTDPKNSRAILVLPLISKIIQRIIYDQTKNFLSDNNVLCQF